MRVCKRPPGHNWSEMSSIFHLCIKPAILLLTNYESVILFLFILQSILCPLRLFCSVFFHPCVTSPATPVPVLRSPSLSSAPPVTIPLFSACCDQLGDISPTDIPGDRTSGGHALLHLSSFCLPSLSSRPTPGCLDTPAPPPCRLLSFLLQTTDPLIRPPAIPQSCTLIPYGADSDISATALLSPVSLLIYPPFPLPFYVQATH